MRPRLIGVSSHFNFQGTYYIHWDQQAEGGEVQHLIGTYAGGVATTVSWQRLDRCVPALEAQR